MKIIILSAICALLFSQPVLADETDAVKKNAKEKINTVVDHVRDKSLETIPARNISEA